MTTGPSPINSSAAGTSLTGLAAQAAKQKNGQSRSRVDREHIADTFEASDREGDGRMLLDSESCSTLPVESGEIGDRLDLSG
ncbi:MAG: hypothetical protein AAF456_19360 [Planctomycetota bacterium]